MYKLKLGNKDLEKIILFVQDLTGSEITNFEIVKNNAMGKTPGIKMTDVTMESEKFSIALSFHEL